jgi:hypothetical protein
MVELTKRYIVMAMASEAPFEASDPDAVFVLKPWKDPAALRALEAYRDNCYPELARDLDTWIVAVNSGPVIRGGVGTRNEPYIKTTGTSAPRAAGRSATKGPSARPSRRTARRPPVRSATKSRAGKAAGKPVHKAAGRPAKRPAKKRR